MSQPLLDNIILIVFLIECFQNPAITIFAKHHPHLSQSLSDPVTIAFMLHKEDLITRQVLTDIESTSYSVTKQREVLLNALKEAIKMKHASLLTFAAVLCKFTSNAQQGMAIHKGYGIKLLLVSTLLP